jgi:molybdopterin molybdotransferase
MISIQEALNIVLENTPSPEFVEIELSKTSGKRLAEDIYSPFPSPRFNNSTMDGFAVKWEDCQSKESFKIIGESRAGVSFKGEVRNGETAAISTGARIPIGADTVIPVEEIEKEGDKIRIKNVPGKSQNVRTIGEEYEINELLIPKDTNLNSAQIALLASIGKSKVKVYKNPAVAVIATGAELSQASAELQEDKIFNSNSAMLESAVNECGGNVVLSAVVEDDLLSTIEILGRAEEISDIILFTGGVSIGEHDYVKKAAEERGFKELFWGVKQKPGKPLFFAIKTGSHRSRLLFGLPGNPVSAYICFFHYAAQTIFRLSCSELLYKRLYTAASQRIVNKKDRAQLLRVKLINEDNTLKFKVLDKQESYMITSISDADGYIIVEENQVIKKDSLTEIFLFPNRW